MDVGVDVMVGVGTGAVRVIVPIGAVVDDVFTDWPLMYTVTVIGFPEPSIFWSDTATESPGPADTWKG